MGHHHHHDHAHHHHHHHHGAGRNLAVAFWLNTGFAIIELLGGLLTNSVAILTDALHDLGDSLALGTAWYFEKRASAKSDAIYTYGYKRFALLGAFINAFVLATGSIFVLSEAVRRLLHPEQPDTVGMFFLAILGVAVNGAALLRLRKGQSINEKVISLHFIEDVLGWIAVLIGSTVMHFVDAPIIDPLLSVGIAVFIVINVYKNMKGALQVVLQGVPINVTEDNVRATLRTFPEIEDAHDIHIWTMDGQYNVLTLHVVLCKAIEVDKLEALKIRIKTALQDNHVHHTTIEFETSGSTCLDQPH